MIAIITHKNTPFTKISTDRATTPVVHYSLAMAFGNPIFVPGQLGFKPGSSESAVCSIEEQTQECLNNLKKTLLAENTDLNHVIKTTIYVSSSAGDP